MVLNDTMGHYHHFRLSCANTSLDCTAIQFSSIDHTNLWDASADENRKIITLFNDKPITEIAKLKIKKRVFEVLDNINPEAVIKELLRVGNKAIVTIPNFGHWKVRLNLLVQGTMPVTKTLPNDWYNTPNIHMCTIKDFFKFSETMNFKIFKSFALMNKNVSTINSSNLSFKNLFCELGIFLIEK